MERMYPKAKGPYIEKQITKKIPSQHRFKIMAIVQNIHTFCTPEPTDMKLVFKSETRKMLTKPTLSEESLDK